MKYIVILIIFICSGVGATELSQKDVQKIKEKLNTFSNIKGEFSQTKTLHDINLELKSTGKFTFMKKAGFIWETVSPIKSVMVYAIKEDIRQNEMCIIFDNNGEKTIEKKQVKQTDEIYDTIQSILRGDVEKLNEIFRISYSQKERGWKLLLDSKKNIVGSFINQIVITGNNDIIQSLVMTVPNKDKISIEFHDISKILETQDAEKISCNQ